MIFQCLHLCRSFKRIMPILKAPPISQPSPANSAVSTLPNVGSSTAAMPQASALLWSLRELVKGGVWRCINFGILMEWFIAWTLNIGIWLLQAEKCGSYYLLPQFQERDKGKAVDIGREGVEEAVNCNRLTAWLRHFPLLLACKPISHLRRFLLRNYFDQTIL